jgi:hypothetical protein
MSRRLTLTQSAQDLSAKTGNTIQGAFDQYAEATVPVNSTAAYRLLVRRAFHAGAMACLCSATDAISNDDLRQQILAKIDTELRGLQP